MKFWGDGLLASVNGLRFVVPVRTVSAAPSPKYFGFKRGITWLNAVSDQVTGIGQMVVPGTPRDSPHILDALLNLDGGVKPEMVATDNASAKTEHLLRVVDPVDDTYRRQMNRQLTAQESRHKPARNVCHGKRGKHRNLNLLGRYSFTASTPAAGALRPLRDPEARELDEDDDGEGRAVVFRSSSGAVGHAAEGG